MKKVVFYTNEEQEEMEFEDTATEEKIAEEFNEWIAGRSGWYFKPNK